MKTFAILLCAIAAVAGAPQGSSATGNAAGNVVTGTTNNGGQTSRITQVSATAGGSASGNSISTNSASASNIGTSGVFGGGQDISQTNAVSNQQTFGSNLFSGIQQPAFPNFNNYNPVQVPVNNYNNRPVNNYNNRRPVNNYNNRRPVVPVNNYRPAQVNTYNQQPNLSGYQRNGPSTRIGTVNSQSSSGAIIF